MLSTTLDLLTSRRGFFFGAAGAVGAAVSATPASAHLFSHISPDPKDQLNLFRRLSNSAVDGETVYLRYSGVTFGVADGTNLVPLYGMEGISPSRSYLGEDGVVRFVANEVGLHTDLETGEVIDTWFNPFTERMVEVWHLRNGPLAYPIDPMRPLNSEGWRLLVNPPGPQPNGFMMPTKVTGDQLVVLLDAQAKRKNPLHPDEWPLESAGETLVYSEHNTWHAPMAEVTSGKPSLNASAAWNSHKPWRPWMLMGQRSGHIYNHLHAWKMNNLDELPAHLRAYLEKNFAQFLSAPDLETVGYKDNWSHFKEHRHPASR